MNTKVGALAILVLMLMAAVPAIAAQNWDELRDAWVTKKQEFLNARADWLDAKAALLDGATPEERRQAVLKLSDMVIFSVRLLRADVEATRGLSDEEKAPILTELDGYISTLQSYRDDLESTVTIEKARVVWQYWLSIQARVKQITAKLLVARAEVVLWRCQAFAAMVEAKIQDLNDNGVDTTQLDGWLSSFNSKLESAQRRIDNAKATIETMAWENVTFWSLFRVAAAHAKTAVDYLKEALRDLRSIIVDMRSRGHTVTLTGSGTLIARGSGSADISGTGLVKVTAIEDSVMIVSSNAHVATDGVGTKEDLENGDVQYRGFGSARVTGTDIRVYLSGNDLTLYAHGRGTATLSGTGWYRTFGENNYENEALVPTGATVTIESGVVQG